MWNLNWFFLSDGKLCQLFGGLKTDALAENQKPSNKLITSMKISFSALEFIYKFFFY